MQQRDLIKQVRRLELVTRRKASSRLAGEYHSVFKGRGMDFDEVQPYAPGDDVRFLDWNVSARTGELFIKKFVEERELTVLIAVDASASMRFGSVEKRKSEIVAELAAILAFSAIRNNDRIGLVIFADDIKLYIPPQKGRKHVLRILREILATEWQGGTTQLAPTLDFIARVTRRRAVVFVLSDFLAPDYERSLKIAAKRHDVVPLLIHDPLEASLPEIRAMLPLRDPETGLLHHVDLNARAHRDAWRQRIQSAHKKRDTLFRRMRLDTIDIDTSQPYMERLIEFFRRRAARH